MDSEVINEQTQPLITVPLSQLNEKSTKRPAIDGTSVYEQMFNFSIAGDGGDCCEVICVHVVGVNADVLVLVTVLLDLDCFLRKCQFVSEDDLHLGIENLL